MVSFLSQPYLIVFQHANCIVSSNGLKFVVEEAKCLQAKAFFQASMFSHFICPEDEELVFRINLDVLLVRQCTNSKKIYL